MPLCKICLKLAQSQFWRTEQKLTNFVNVFSLFCNYLPLKKGRALHLNKIKSPSPKDALCQVLLKWSSGSVDEEDENMKIL